MSSNKRGKRSSGSSGGRGRSNNPSGSSQLSGSTQGTVPEASRRASAVPPGPPLPTTGVPGTNYTFGGPQESQIYAPVPQRSSVLSVPQVNPHIRHLGLSPVYDHVPDAHHSYQRPPPRRGHTPLPEEQRIHHSAFSPITAIPPYEKPPDPTPYALDGTVAPSSLPEERRIHHSIFSPITAIPPYKELPDPTPYALDGTVAPSSDPESQIQRSDGFLTNQARNFPPQQRTNEQHEHSSLGRQQQSAGERREDERDSSTNDSLYADDAPREARRQYAQTHGVRDVLSQEHTLPSATSRSDAMNLDRERRISRPLLPKPRTDVDNTRRPLLNFGAMSGIQLKVETSAHRGNQLIKQWNNTNAPLPSIEIPVNEPHAAYRRRIAHMFEKRFPEVSNSAHEISQRGHATLEAEAAELRKVRTAIQVLSSAGVAAADPTPRTRNLTPGNIHLHSDWEEIHGVVLGQLRQHGLMSAYEDEYKKPQTSEDLDRDKDYAAIRFMRGNGVEVNPTPHNLPSSVQTKITNFAAEKMGRAACKPNHPRRRGESPPPGAGGSGGGGGGGGSFGTGYSSTSASQSTGFGSYNYGQQQQQGGYQGYHNNQRKHEQSASHASEAKNSRELEGIRPTSTVAKSTRSVPDDAKSTKKNPISERPLTDRTRPSSQTIGAHNPVPRSGQANSRSSSHSTSPSDMDYPRRPHTPVSRRDSSSRSGSNDHSKKPTSNSAKKSALPPPVSKVGAKPTPPAMISAAKVNTASKPVPPTVPKTTSKPTPPPTPKLASKPAPPRSEMRKGSAKEPKRPTSSVQSTSTLGSRKVSSPARKPMIHPRTSQSPARLPASTSKTTTRTRTTSPPSGIATPKHSAKKSTAIISRGGRKASGESARPLSRSHSRSRPLKRHSGISTGA